MRLLPFARGVVLLRRRHIDHVLDPAVPFRRNARGFGIAVIDHPAPFEAQRRVDRPALGAVVAVALIVGADQFAEAPGPQLRAKSLAAPPGEEFQQKLFHPISAAVRRGLSRDAIGWLNCPAAPTAVQKAKCAKCRRISAIRSSPIQPVADRLAITHKWCRARERLPLSRVGKHPGNGAENEQSESFEYGTRTGA